MAWTDSCKIEAVQQIKKKAEESSIRQAIKELSEESDIPIGTLDYWFYQRSREKEDYVKNHVTLLEERSLIQQDAEVQIFQQASKVRKEKRQRIQEVEKKIKQELIEQPLPQNKYHTIVIDPPWPMDKILRDNRPNQSTFDYPRMTIQEITDFKTSEFAADNCHIYLWTTHRFLPVAFLIMQEWGFKYQCLMTWVKNVGFTPFSWMYSTEHVLFGRKGNLEMLKKGTRLDFNAKTREHSRKPDEFYEIVRQASPGPRIDIFSREQRNGFEQFGNEVERF